MIDRTTKLRWRRNFRRKQRQLEDIGSQTEEHLDRHFFRRLGRLYEVRRFIISWLMLLVLLAGLTVVQTRALGGYYQSVTPLSGGIYSEGIVGSFTNANPIFAASEVDSSVSRLLFSGLMTYNSNNQLIGELAKNWSVDPTGRVYTVTLNSGITWHDGEPLTAADVAYTYRAIQNPDTRSPQFGAWQGIKVDTPDDYTIVFTLPNILASFPYSLTGGILPKHILEGTEEGNLRSALFNTTQPIGSGPFKWNGVEVRGNKVEDREQWVSLSANPEYFKGKPKLSQIIIRTYLDEGQMLRSFNDGELTAMAGVQEPTDKQKEDTGISQYNIPVSGEVMVFMNNNSEILRDVQVRRGLVSGVDQQEILSGLGYASIVTKSPFLKGMLGYDPSVLQRPFSLNDANASLDAAGWARGANGMRAKDGKPLTLTLNTLDNMEYAQVANSLKSLWAQVGVTIEVTSLDQTDLQGIVDNRSYDLLLYGISLGVDPDQFAYWHSSQADVRAQRRLNFSNYSSKTADSALEAGRTRIDNSLRAAKYKPFLEAWREDAPAVALYQPRYLYMSRGVVFNFDAKVINAPSDRYENVQNWMIRTERTTNE